MLLSIPENLWQNSLFVDEFLLQFVDCGVFGFNDIFLELFPFYNRISVMYDMLCMGGKHNTPELKLLWKTAAGPQTLSAVIKLCMLRPSLEVIM